jgi:hypothetical protein
MSEILTLQEMKARYAPEWVLIKGPQSTGDHVDDLAGEVVFHSPDRDEVIRKALELPPPRDVAIRYLGTRPNVIRLSYI